MIPETNAALLRVRAFLDARDASLKAIGVPSIGPGVLTSWDDGEHDYELTAVDLQLLLAAAVVDTPSTTSPGRCPDVLQFEPARHHPDVQCALYPGHLEQHETQPIAPIREDRKDGVHMFLWTRRADGKLLEVDEQRIGDDPGEALGAIDVC